MGKGKSFGLVLVSALYSLNVCICAEETATHNTCMLSVYFFPTSVLVKVMMSYLQETDTGHEGSHFSSYCSLVLFLCIFCEFLYKYSHDTSNNHPVTHTHTHRTSNLRILHHQRWVLVTYTYGLHVLQRYPSKCLGWKHMGPLYWSRPKSSGTKKLCAMSEYRHVLTYPQTTHT
jgi:hypothetical protein